LREEGAEDEALGCSDSCFALFVCCAGCGSVQQAEDVLYAYMEKKEKLPARVAWKDEAQRCVHYTLRKTPADGTQVLVKLVSGEQGVFLRLYHRKGFVLTDAAKKAPAFRPLPRMEEAVLGAPAQNISPAARPGWSASGEHMAKRYAYAEYAALEEALRVCEASLQTGCGLAAEEPAYSESENGETEGYIVFRDESRPWCNTIRFAGAGAGCAAALVFDTGKNMLEVYLSSRYRDWYTQNGT